jgi:hypothetical protein
MAFCGSCGHEIAPGARFCFNCGQQAAPGSNPGTPSAAGAPATPGTYAPPAQPVAFSANKGRAVAVYIGLALTVLSMIGLISVVSTQKDQLTKLEALSASRDLAGLQALVAEVEENDDTIESINVLLVLVFLGTTTAFAFWTHRAYTNLLSFNAGALPSSVSFAVWSFLIPVANIYLGWLRLKEMWQASSAQGINSATSGINWKSVATPWFISVWWFGYGVLLIARSILGASKPGDDSPDAIDKLQSYDSALILLSGAAIVLCGLGAFAVMQITRRQNEAHALMQAPPPYEAGYPAAAV